MRVTVDYTNETRAQLLIVAEDAELQRIKEHVLKELGERNANIPGFRKGKAPLSLIEKQLDPNLVQSEFIEHVVNDLYGKAIDQEKLRPVAQPEVNITKFVPYNTLEFSADVEVIGKVKLADYKNIKVEKKKVSVTAKDVEQVLEQLQQRDAETKDVTRAAKEGDTVVIDFSGADTKTKEPIAGADGKEYPLRLGSDSFIPGFEQELVGLKAGEEKSFDITFPKDYGVKALQSRKVTFTVKVHKVQEAHAAKLDDAFAAKVGPFKSLQELKDDIKKQLTAERENEIEREYENELVTKIAEKSTVAVPKVMVDNQLERMELEEKQNLVYRGQTWQEHLKQEGKTEEEHREEKREPAELHVKAGLVLSEIAEAEQLTVTPDELAMQIQVLKQQYPDQQMQAELDKPENQRELISRILTQKTLDKIKQYASTQSTS
jgi:trigger factor